MKQFAIRLRDWWRGYSDNDLCEAHEWLYGLYGWECPLSLILLNDDDAYFPPRVIATLAKAAR